MTHHRLSQRVADEQGWVLISATILTLIMLSIALVAAGLDRQRHQPHPRAARARVGAERRRGRPVRAEPRDADSLAERRDDRRRHRPALLPGHLLLRRHVRRSPLPEQAQPRGGQLEQPGRGRLPERRRARQRLLDDQGARQRRRARDGVRSRITPNDAQAGCTVPASVVPATACTYDANKDRELWVQSQAIVRGKPRNVVARLRLEQLSESVPQAAVTSGAVKVTNSGNHGGTAIIDATGSQRVRALRQPGPGELRGLQERPDQAGRAAERHDGAEPDVARPAAALQAARDHRRQVLQRLPGPERPGLRPVRPGGLGRGLRQPAEPHQQHPDDRLRRGAPDRARPATA